MVQRPPKSGRLLLRKLPRARQIPTWADLELNFCILISDIGAFGWYKLASRLLWSDRHLRKADGQIWFWLGEGHISLIPAKILCPYTEQLETNLGSEHDIEHCCHIRSLLAQELESGIITGFSFRDFASGCEQGEGRTAEGAVHFWGPATHRPPVLTGGIYVNRQALYPVRETGLWLDLGFHTCPLRAIQRGNKTK